MRGRRKEADVQGQVRLMRYDMSDDSDILREFADGMHWAIVHSLDQGLHLPIKVTIGSHDGSQLRLRVIKVGPKKHYDIVHLRSKKSWRLVFPVTVRMEDRRIVQEFTVTHEDQWQDMQSIMMH